MKKKTTNDRRTLLEGLEQTPPPIDPKLEKDFVFQSKGPSSSDVSANGAANTSQNAQAVAKSPLSTRIRSDIATALKRASLERQLGGIEPNTVQDILEQVLEPWLRSEGYLS